MRDPHYQWIGSIRNRQGTSDDTDHYLVPQVRTSFAETDASIATPHPDSKNHELNHYMISMVRMRTNDDTSIPDSHHFYIQHVPDTDGSDATSYI